MSCIYTYKNKVYTDLEQLKLDIGQEEIRTNSPELLPYFIPAYNLLRNSGEVIPHEYAHHYIAWYRNTPIVQEAIKKWGSEEALVQAIGEQVVTQKGEAWNWWIQFSNWIKSLFSKLSTLDKENLKNILTDAFLTREDLNKLANQISPNDKQILMFAALLHDISKPETTKEEYSEKLGRTKITAKGHEAAGAIKALDILERIGIQKDNIEIIAALIREHLAHATISSLDKERGKRSAFIKLMDRLKPANVEQLMLLMEADMLGRNNASQDTPVSILEFDRLLNDYKVKNEGKMEFTPLLMGRHLIQKGLKPGVEFTTILRKAREAQLNLDFTDEPEALEWLNNYLTVNDDSTQTDIANNSTNSSFSINDVTWNTIKDKILAKDEDMNEDIWNNLTNDEKQQIIDCL